MRSHATAGMFVVHPNVCDFERLRVLPVYRKAFRASHAQPVSVHKDISTNLLFGGKVHVTASLASGAVLCNEPFGLTVAVTNDSERTIHGTVGVCNCAMCLCGAASTARTAASRSPWAARRVGSRWRWGRIRAPR